MTVNQRANSLVPHRSLGSWVGDDADAFPKFEQFVHDYLEGTPLGTLLVDVAGVIQFANRQALQCFGYHASELAQQPIQTLLSVTWPLDFVHGPSATLNGDPTRSTLNYRMNGRCKDGTMRPVAVGFYPLLYDGYQRIACSILDLTNIHHHTDHDELARFFDLSLDLFCIADAHGHFLRINGNFTRVLGHSEDVLLSQTFLNFVHPDDHQATWQAIEQLAHGQPVVHFRNRYRTATGDYRWFDWSSRAVTEQGRVYAVARDVTDQVRLEEELLARERRERAILENTPAIVYVKNCQGRYEYVNQRHADLVGLSAEQVIGQSDQELFPAENADTFRANDERVLEQGVTITVQETLPLDDGVHTFVSTKFPLYDAQAMVTAVAGISTDITDQIQAREMANQLRLARAFQMKLYPTAAPAVCGLDASGSAVPVAQVCGDYYDFIPNGPGQLIVAMGDVSGHGIGPALEMVAVRTAMRLLLREDGRLLRTIGRLNEMLCGDLPESSFVSMFLAELDATKRQIRYIGAGHEALVVRSSGAIERLESTSMLLGIDAQAEFVEHVTGPLEPGDVFVLYTDGLTEAMNLAGKQFGTPHLMELLKQHPRETAEDIIISVFSAVYEFSSGKTIADDMTIVAIKFV